MRYVKRLAGGLLLLALCTAGVAWWQRTPLLTWYAVRGLTSAGEGERQPWIDRIVDLGEPAVPALLEALEDSRESARGNAVAALDALARQQGLDDPRSAALLQQQVRLFARLHPDVQRQMLERIAGWFADRQHLPGGEVAGHCSRLLAESAATADAEVRRAGLELAAVLMNHPGSADMVPAVRESIRAGLRSRRPACRLRAIQLTLLPGLGLPEEVAGLLRDPATEVRRAALLAVGPADQIVGEESLLPCLHDDDAEIRQLAEATLRGRGIKEEHLQLGRLLTHPRAEERLRVLDRLGSVADLDPGLWLRRLSHDSSPGVRAAALRVMSRQTLVDLSDRIDQMARNDPSPTVCALAQYYLMKRQRGSSIDRLP